jgi:hypothetical protein
LTQGTAGGAGRHDRLINGVAALLVAMAGPAQDVRAFGCACRMRMADRALSPPNAIG